MEKIRADFATFLENEVATEITDDKFSIFKRICIGQKRLSERRVSPMRHPGELLQALTDNAVISPTNTEFLCDCLRYSSIGENVLAETVAKAYPTTQDMANKGPTTRTPQQVASAVVYDETDRSMAGRNPAPEKAYIGIVAALEFECSAVEFILDDNSRRRYEGTQPVTDTNVYILGTISNRPIVLTTLPVATYGEGPAAVTVTNLCQVFPSIGSVYMVGIAGGIPNVGYDEDAAMRNSYISHVRKGDVIISYPIATDGPSFIQYDYGKIQFEDTFENIRANLVKNEKSAIRLSPTALAAAREIKSGFQNHSLTPWVDVITAATANLNHQNKIQYGRPGAEKDILTDDGVHPEESMLRDPGQPKVHFGIIASANSVMKNGAIRDKIARAANIIGFEMENNGVATAAFLAGKRCMFVRGVCDYSDEGKDKTWQRYAALAAAAVAKVIIEKLPNN